MTTSLTVPVAEDAPRRQPAPGDLELIRQFVNTYDAEEHDYAVVNLLAEAAWEQFTSPAALEKWLAERGLLSSEQRLTDRDLKAALTFRDALRDELAANAGHGDREAARHTLDHLASHYPLRMRINGEAWLEPSRGRGVSQALARMLATIYQAMTVGTWERLKICTNDECAWAFYDHSRNRSGAWCTMAVCGNRMKGRAFRTRRAQRGEG